ncbi:glycoside hydrolase family 88 protein [Pelagicoccus sp. SDUM812003]|uniref:glycoside hydrolase family 88/105 protein n=1 Tax=Pelagicoccus sp. SDUM812003 TaxID=3041267 RepID=UPI0028101D22|nr:glycoside hydrolase family 88 protein [Pelagicoccus sp. SDUM812003]MDQ8202633.1 glycoside hydrolase family 88 protein [Pelagicoccus sp. SDUM812003]
MKPPFSTSLGYYFDESRCMAELASDRPEETLSVIARRFKELNPRAPVSYRAFCTRGIQRAKDYRYEADFNRFFPEAQNEEYVFAWSKMWSALDAEMMFDINCYGPIVVYLNGKVAWESNIFTERYPNKHNRFTLTLRKGWNQFVIRAKKTRGGFGWKFGSWLGKHPYVFMMPSAERSGQEGWLYTDPFPAKVEVKPALGQSEADSSHRWHPCNRWEASPQEKGVFARIFGPKEGKTALGWTKLENASGCSLQVVAKGRAQGSVRILLDGNDVCEVESGETIHAEFSVEPGRHDLVALCVGDQGGWGFDLELSSDGPVATKSPCDLKGSSETWLYAGPFDAERPPRFDDMRDFYFVHETSDGPGYWRLDAPDTYLRLYNENPLFGRWNYPLGVTVYGLLHAGLALGDEEICSYVRDHVQVCCSSYPYSLWDRSQFGGPTHMHRLLSSIDSLDDCGSFGSSMLEVAQHCDLKGYERIAHFVAEFIANKQDRFPDGAFYRREMMHEFHENTMWADDLYMSVPFLCRYYQLTGDRRYVDDAARQFLGFRKRLYIPEEGLMSHVYDLRREMATGVPWGRGNGWTVFSLAELLGVLPEDHENREELLSFFRELCAGILALQDSEGYWHQVLTHLDSYPETSCTAMFIFGFSRGIRHGWLEEPAPYSEAVFKAWTALNRASIDRDGNVYGVCRGSEFSFSPEYYKKDLLPRLNDTHGIGIVLLAGVEVIRLRDFQEAEKSNQLLA